MVYILNGMWHKAWLRRHMIPSEKLFTKLRSLSSFRRLLSVQQDKISHFKGDVYFRGKFSNTSVLPRTLPDGIRFHQDGETV